MNISNTRSDYIILTNNIIDVSNINIGTNLHIKTKIIDSSGSSSYDISWQHILYTLTPSHYKNRIILSGKIKTNFGSTSTSCCLITKNNIKNNMKYVLDISNNSSGKILFVKNLDISDNSFNYLFNDLSNVYFENNMPKNLNNNNFTNSADTSYNRYIYNLNYYFSNSDFYKINIRDYLYKYAKETTTNNLATTSERGNYSRRDLNYETISYSIRTISNDFSFINVTIDSSSSINFKASDFERVLIDNSGINNFNNSGDTNLNILQLNRTYTIYRNIWSYNILTLDYKHVNYYDFSLNKTFNSDVSNTNTTITTFLIKTNNFRIIQNIKKSSKIIFGLGNIYLNNVEVLDITSTSYTNNLKVGKNLRNFTDASNIIFLRLGKRFTGITQRDIYNNVHFSTNNNKKLTIVFKRNINTNNIKTNPKFAQLIPKLTTCYLLDISLNYNNKSNNIVNSYNINNTINFNTILFNNIQSHPTKVMNLDYNSYFDALSNNYLKNSFDNLARLNITTTNANFYSISYEKVNSATYIEFKDITYSENAKIYNKTTLETKLIPLNSNNGYDFRYNYGITFYVTNKLNILVNLNSLNLTNTDFLDYRYYENNRYSVANFYSLKIDNLVTTTGASDFTNVDCVYIYHDPINDPDPNFRYPNNNIEIKYDNEIDTFAKAIEQIRGTGGRTSTSNVAFIPAQNGSNLSRKMIQGIIGLNNIPKLLSIVPYDPSFINGRGFINQYQITDTCIEGSCNKIAIKQNAIKHDSVKNNSLYASNSLKKQNFVNAVRSSARNKLSLECIKSRLSTNQPPINPPCNNANVSNIQLRYTPMTPRTTRSSWPHYKGNTQN